MPNFDARSCTVLLFVNKYMEGIKSVIAVGGEGY